MNTLSSKFSIVKLSGKTKNADLREISRTENIVDNTFKTSMIDIWALGITIVIGGQYFSWNAGLVAGFGTYSIAIFLIGLSYTSLCFCTSELSSALPFAGGAYGLARCTLGFSAGFTIGCCETLEYILYVAASAMSLGSMISNTFSLPDTFQPLIWLIFYLSALTIHINGGRFFWRFNFVIAIISIVILLIFAFGSLPWVNFTANTVDTKVAWNDGGITEFMKVLPLASWFFVGVEALNMACDDIDEPKINIPRGQISCIFTLFVTAVMVLFITSSLPIDMDTLISDLTPLNYGFMLMFKIPYRTATLFSLPATYATAFGFIYSYGKLITAMSMSKLLPGICNMRSKRNGSPYVALIVGSIIGYSICLLVYFVPYIGLQLFNICIFFAFAAYTAQCIGYIQLQTKFQNLPRSFRSPLGMAGAVYSLFIWILGIISLITFQQDHHFAFISFLVIVSGILLYYYFFARHKQTFSEEEKKILFVAHVINNNTNKKKRLRSSVQRSSIKSASSLNTDNKKGNDKNKKHHQPPQRQQQQQQQQSSIGYQTSGQMKKSLQLPLTSGVEKKCSSVGPSDYIESLAPDDETTNTSPNKGNRRGGRSGSASSSSSSNTLASATSMIWRSFKKKVSGSEVLVHPSNDDDPTVKKVIKTKSAKELKPLFTKSLKTMVTGGRDLAALAEVADEMSMRSMSGSSKICSHPNSTSAFSRKRSAYYNKSMQDKGVLMEEKEVEVGGSSGNGNNGINKTAK